MYVKFIVVAIDSGKRHVLDANILACRYTCNRMSCRSKNLVNLVQAFKRSSFYILYACCGMAECGSVTIL